MIYIKYTIKKITKGLFLFYFLKFIKQPKTPNITKKKFINFFCGGGGAFHCKQQPLIKSSEVSPNLFGSFPTNSFTFLPTFKFRLITLTFHFIKKNIKMSKKRAFLGEICIFESIFLIFSVTIFLRCVQCTKTLL